MTRFNFKLLQDLNQPFLRDAEFHEAVNAYLKSRKFYFDQIKLAGLYAEVMATEYYVCAGIGFTKYLN